MENIEEQSINEARVNYGNDRIEMKFNDGPGKDDDNREIEKEKVEEEGESKDNDKRESDLNNPPNETPAPEINFNSKE